MTRRDFFKGLGIAGMMAALPISTTTFSSILTKREYELIQGSPMKIYDIWPEVKKLVSRETASAVEATKIRDTVVFYDVVKESETYRKARIVRFFGVTAASLDEGVAKLAEIIEDVNSRYHILGSLAKSIAVKLMDGTFACVAYLDVEKWEDTGKHEYSLTEGGYPKPTLRAASINYDFKMTNLGTIDNSSGYFNG